MMNKNMFLSIGLMFSVATTVLSIGEQEREVLYTLHALGQDFKKVKMALVKNALATGAVIATRMGIFLGIELLGKYVDFSEWSKAVDKLSFNMQAVFGQMGITYAAVSLYDVFKERKALVEALALDKEIFGKLIELKQSVAFNSAQTGNELLDSVVNN